MKERKEIGSKNKEKHVERVSEIVERWMMKKEVEKRMMSGQNRIL